MDIAITAGRNGNYRTTATGPTDPPVKPGDVIDFWFSRPDGFPADSILFAQFFRKNASGAKVDDRGCLNGPSWSQGRGTTTLNGSAITGGHVKNLARGTFPYLIGYTDTNGRDNELLDPEIVVEGNLIKKPKSAAKSKKSRSVSSRRPLTKAKKTARKTAKKKAVRPSAKQATKPTPRRKAKKR